MLVGEIGRPHGVRGLVKLRSFTADPSAIVAYGPLTDAHGSRRFTLTLLGDGLARIDGVTDRDAAARLTGTGLYVDREALPPPEAEEFYLADLIGLAAVTETGHPLGRVLTVEDHGAGPFLQIRDAAGKECLVPFTRAAVPIVDLAAGCLVVLPPQEIVVQGDAPAAGDTRDVGAAS